MRQGDDGTSNALRKWNLAMQRVELVKSYPDLELYWFRHLGRSACLAL